MWITWFFVIVACVLCPYFDICESAFPADSRRSDDLVFSTCYISSPVLLTIVNMPPKIDPVAPKRGGSMKVAIPIYDPKKNYDLYKSELCLWQAVTNLELGKQGGAVVLSLPNDEECSLRTSILEKT